MYRKLVVAVTLLLLLLSPGLKAENLDLVCSEWEPYVSKNLENMGPLAELVTAAFKKGGYDSEVSTHAWADAIAGAKNASHDGARCAWFSKERNKDFRFSSPIMLNRLSFLKLKSAKISWDRIPDLEPYRFAKLKDGVISKKFDNSGLQIREEKQQIDAIRLLIGGEVDMVPGDEGEALALIERYVPESAADLDFVEKSVATNSLHLIISRSHPKSKELISAFNKGIEAMRADGSYDALLEKHGMERLGVK